jgi:hypothetical protein
MGGSGWLGFDLGWARAWLCWGLGPGLALGWLSAWALLWVWLGLVLGFGSLALALASMKMPGWMGCEHDGGPGRKRRGRVGSLRRDWWFSELVRSNGPRLPTLDFALRFCHGFRLLFMSSYVTLRNGQGPSFSGSLGRQARAATWTLCFPLALLCFASMFYLPPFCGVVFGLVWSGLVWR